MEFLELKNSAISTESALSQTVKEILHTPNPFLVTGTPAMTGTQENLQKAGEKAVQQDLIGIKRVVDGDVVQGGISFLIRN